MTECGLVKIKMECRERYYEAKLETLAKVAEWTNQYKHFWTNKLDALELHLSKKTTKKIKLQTRY